MISRSHMRTHASKPNHFKSWVLWDWVSSINSTCFSFNIIVSERETSIQEYHVRTWHYDQRIPSLIVTLRSNNTINLSFNITTFTFVSNISSSLLYSNHFFDRDGIRLYIPRSRDFRPITKHTTKPHNHTIKYIENFTTSFNAYQSLLRVYYQIA